MLSTNNKFLLSIPTQILLPSNMKIHKKSVQFAELVN